MTLQSHAPYQSFDLGLIYGTPTTNTGNTAVLSNSLPLAALGFTCANPFDSAWKTQRAQIPFRGGEIELADGTQAATNIILTNQIYKTSGNNNTFFTDIYGSSFHKKIREAGEADYCYLRLGMWNGASYTYYRKYCTVQSFSMPMKSKTSLTVSEIATITLRTVDPHWYTDTVTQDTESIVGGSGNQVLTPQAYGRTGRVRFIITKTGGTNPTDVSITNAAGDAITMDGSLTSANQYWAIDCYGGTVRKGTAVGNETDSIAEFGGDFIDIAASAEVLTIADTASASFDVTIQYIDLIG